MLRSFIVSILLVITTSVNTNAQVNFNGLNAGEILGNQLLSQGVRFIPYSNKIKGEVVADPGGNIAVFDICFGCEFFPSVANIVFTNTHSTVTIHTGLVLTQTAVNREIHLDAFDAGGTLIASKALIMTSGTGYDHEMTVTSPTANIASVLVQSVNDPAANANIAIKEILFDNTGSGPPDFLLQGLSTVEIVAGGPSVDYTINILRLGNSTGAITFSDDMLPAGVTGTFIPPASTGAFAVLRFNAAPNASSTVTAINIKGDPASSSVGPSQRKLPIILTVSQAFTIHSVPEINLSGCNQAGPTGSVAIPVSVLRQWSVKGPVTLSVEGLPGNVTASFAPSILNFSGNAIGDQSTLTFIVNAGVDIPDGLISIKATNGVFSSVFFADLHGMCPRHNKDFTIRGSFFSNHLGLVRPIQGAVVEIYREVTAWYDDMVDKTFTKDDGSFEVHRGANDEDTYYAKLKLNDEKGVYLHGSWSTNIWDINSNNRGNNRGPVIDLGNTIIEVDGGNSTPKASIWQGSHHAYQEFVSTTGVSPPTGDYEIRIWKGFLYPYSYRSTTEWPDNYHTHVTFSDAPSSPQGTDNFFDYSVSFHEFGHAIRHSFDGDINHFNWDNTRFFYGREHEVCDSKNFGFAFNEGWAEFWAQEPRFYAPCPSGILDFEKEFNVAFDLTSLMTCTGRSRREMVEFLGSKQEFIHSDNDFREQFKIHFSTDLSACPVGTPFSTRTPALRMRKLVLNDPTAAAQKLESEISYRAQIIREFQGRLREATQKANEIKSAKPGEMNLKQIAVVVTEPMKIEGQIALLDLLQSAFQKQLDSLKRGRFRSPDYTPEFDAKVRMEEFAFDNQSRIIAVTTLERCKTALSPYLSQDSKGDLKEIVAGLDRKLRLLNTKSVGSIDVFSLLKIPPAALSNETVNGDKAKHSTWWIWALAIIIVLSFIAWLAFRSRKK